MVPLGSNGLSPDQLSVQTDGEVCDGLCVCVCLNKPFENDEIKLKMTIYKYEEVSKKSWIFILIIINSYLHSYGHKYWKTCF